MQSLVLDAQQCSRLSARHRASAASAIDRHEGGLNAVLGEHGVDDLDDRFLIIGTQCFDMLEASVEPSAGEGRFFAGGAGEQVIDAGREDVCEFDQHLGGRDIEPALVLVELLEANVDLAGHLFLRPMLGLAQRLESGAEGLSKFGVLHECEGL